MILLYLLSPAKPKSKVKPSKDASKENKDAGKENTQPPSSSQPAKKATLSSSRDPVFGEAPLTRHWGRNAGPVHGIILGKLGNTVRGNPCV